MLEYATQLVGCLFNINLTFFFLLEYFPHGGFGDYFGVNQYVGSGHAPGSQAFARYREIDEELRK